MGKKTRLWVAGALGVLTVGLASVNVYALEESDILGTWYLNGMSMGGEQVIHPGALNMEMTIEFKEGGKMESIFSSYGEESKDTEWKIEDDKLFITNADETKECEYSDGTITVTDDGTKMILNREKEEYEPYVPGAVVENPKLEEFEGDWNCVLMDMFGMQMPVGAETTGFEMMISIADGKASLLMIEGDTETNVELAGEVEGNALVLKATSEKEEDPESYSMFSTDVMRFNLLDDGYLCLADDDDSEEAASEETVSEETAEDSETELDGDSYSIKAYFAKLVVTE